ncbi:MAG TPA: O-antigen ligase family protein, partial [Pirellulales bacterium]|nr:O-antigen ligase family protein [Pirellulales bacterium]
MEFLLAIAAITLAAWLFYFALCGSLLAGCLAFLITASCFGYPFAHFDIGPIPATLDRIVIAVLAIVYLVQRRLGLADPKPLETVDKLILAFLAFLTVSTFTHNWQDKPACGVPPVWQLMTGYLMPACVYWIARQSRLTERNVVFVHGALACFGIYLAVTGLAEVSRQWWLVFPSYISDPSVGLHFGRARGPMVQAVSYGFFLGVTLLAGYVWRSRWNRFGQLLWLVIAAVELAAIVATFTRSVWIGTALAIIVALAISLRGAWRPLVIGALVSAALVLSVAKLDTLANLQREGSAIEARESAEMRASFAYVSWQMFLDRPIFGFGFGQFYREKLPYLSDHSTALQLESIRDFIHHNTYLSLLTETGLIGLGLYLAILFGFARRGWRLSRDENPHWKCAHGVLLLGTLATYAVQMMFHEVSYTAIDNSLFMLISGIAVGLTVPRRDEPGDALAFRHAN